MLRRLRFVSLDVSGTVADGGCKAPVALFQQAFSAARVPITVAEARKHMGLAKRDHVRSMFAQPALQQRWLGTHGKLPSEQDEEVIYSSLAAFQTPVLRKYSTPIRGARETFEWCRNQRLLITGTTGYTHSMMAAIAPQLAQAGLRFDALSVSDGVVCGRPSPLMIEANMAKLGLFERRAGVKVGDTAADMDEGRNAGLWTVGVIDTSNTVGCSEQEFAELDSDTCDLLRDEARQQLKHADLLIPTIADLPEALLAIDRLLASKPR